MMPNERTYLCWHCASEQGLAREINPTTLMNSEYQLAKFVKHTVVDPIFKLAGVFKDPQVSSYEKWVVNSVASGCVVLTPNSTHEYVFLASQQVGVTYKHGSFHTAADAVKVVLPTSPEKVHAYPISSHVIAAKKCAKCGRPVAG
jgi:hypothetical protein